MKTISIIGSFRKHDNYSKVVEIINSCKKHGIDVLSPAGTDVVNSIEDFVIFESDDKSLSPVEIEMATLKNILSSDIVYVCDTNGYIGITTAYELGICEVKNKEIYFMEQPKDLPMRLSIKVLSPSELINYILKEDKKESKKLS